MNYVGRSPGITLVGDVNPVGAIGWFHGVPNASYLQLNGQIVAKATYPDLWTYAQPYLTANQAVNPGLFRDVDGATFALPNFAGLFLRAIGGTAAAVGVKQADDLKPHAHTATGTVSLVGVAQGSDGGGVSCISRRVQPAPAIGLDAASGSVAVTVNNSAGAESRPNNIALVACIKATSAYVVPPTISAIAFGAMQTFIASGIYTKTPGVKRIKVTVVGGGGAGGACGATSVSQVCCGGGGGGGGASIKMIDAALLAASEVVTVGIGGVVAAGGNSSFGAHCFAGGGGLGQAGVPASPCAANGGPGGSGANGDLNMMGAGGGCGLGPGSAVYVISGTGGSSLLGGGARGKVNTLAGDNGGTYGGGGSGAASGPSAGALAGGNGAAGVVIVEEFF